MNRSKSTSTTKNKKTHSQQTNHKNKQLKIAIADHQDTVRPQKDIHQSHCPHTVRDSVQERLANIRKGFQTLQKNLHQYTPHLTQLTSPNRLLHKKDISKKLFDSQNKTKSKKNWKTVTNLHKNKTKSSLKQKNIHTAHPQKYHTCLYQKSLFDLMKIVSLQKAQITKLNEKLYKKHH